jgi:hypothetical protein
MQSTVSAGSFGQNYLPPTLLKDGKKPLIVQYSRVVSKRKFDAVTRCLAIGQSKYADHTEKFLLAGCQDKNLYRMSPNMTILQTIPFNQWVRCIATGDLNNDGIDDLAAGIGDKTLRIFNRVEDEYIEAISYNFENFVNTCAIADIDGDGIKEVLAGSWDKTMVVLDGQSFKIKWSKKFFREVDLIKVADVNWDGKPEVIVLVKGGEMHVLEGATGEELWSFKDEKDLLAVDCAPLDAGGFPYVVVGGNSQKLFFFDRAGKQVHSIDVKDQILAISLADIDGGDHNEITLGLSQNLIAVYHLVGTEISSIERKWTTKTSGAICAVLVSDLNADGKNEIIYGGYDCAVTAIQDFYYGEKENLNICKPDISCNDNEPVEQASPLSGDSPVGSPPDSEGTSGESDASLASTRTEVSTPSDADVGSTRVSTVRNEGNGDSSTKEGDSSRN